MRAQIPQEARHVGWLQRLGQVSLLADEATTTTGPPRTQVTEHATGLESQTLTAAWRRHTGLSDLASVMT